MPSHFPGTRPAGRMPSPAPVTFHAGADSSTAPPATGPLCLSSAELERICLIHLISGIDEDGPDGMADSAIATLITGYTEWIGDGDPVVTVGWDWKMTFDASRVRLVRVSEPCSNVALRGADGANLGPVVTAIYLASVVDGFNWQEEALQYINIRYQN